MEDREQWLNWTIELQALAQGVVLKAHIGVGFVPVIVAVEVVVEGEGAVALLTELVAQGEGHVVL